MKILLEQWAASNYSPAPSRWVLRKWTREGEIVPAPEKVGASYYVDESAARKTEPARKPLVDRLKSHLRSA